MPNRVRVVESMVRRRVGANRYRHKEDLEVARAYVEADATYVEVVEGIDWNRVMLLAVDRHDQLLHQDKEHLDVGALYAECTGEEQADAPKAVPCGDCIVEAALSLRFATLFTWDVPASERSRRARPIEDFQP